MPQRYAAALHGVVSFITVSTTGNVELQVEALHRPYIPAPLPLHLFTLGVELIP
jgi:hypothetical protein